MIDCGRIEFEVTYTETKEIDTVTANHRGSNFVQMTNDFLAGGLGGFVTIDGDTIKICQYTLKRLSQDDGIVLAEVLR